MYKFAVALATIATLTKAEEATLELRELVDQVLTQTVKPPYYERAKGPEDLGWFKGSTYKAKGRYEKMYDLWQMVTEDTSGPREPYWSEFPLAFVQESKKTFYQDSDELKKNRLKIFHTQGVVAKVKYVPVENSGMSGMLGEGSDTVLLRFSETGMLHEESKGLTPAVAIKFLRDGTISSNIVAQSSFQNSGSWNFFKEPLRTRIDSFDPEEDQIWIDTLQQKLLDNSAKPFLMSFSETFTMNNDGTDVPFEDFGMIPYELQFESPYQFSDTKTDTPWHEQLTSITYDPEKPLLEVYALTAPYQRGGERVKIGHIELMSEITTSKFGDERLFFQHVRPSKDKQYWPKGWGKYDFKIDEDESGWGMIAPDTWPSGEEEAK